MAITECTGDARVGPETINECRSIILDDEHLTVFKDLTKRVFSYDDAVKLAQEVLKWESGDSNDDEPPWSDAVDKVFERQQQIIDGKVQEGYSWGLDVVDRYLTLCPGKLYTIAGIKKGAKTLFALFLLAHNLTKQVPSMLFSLEMSVEEIAKRILSNRAGVNSRSVFDRHISQLDRASLQAVRDEVKAMPLVVNDSPNLGIFQLISRARRWKFRNNIPAGQGIIVVDFIQYVDTERKRGESEASALARVAYGLATLAKQLKCVVIAIGQFRNEAETEKPHIRFLQGSGGIAQASEAIILVDYVPRREEYTNEPIKWPQPFNLILAEQRSGERGRIINLQADLTTGMFYETMGGPDETKY
jgi:replicative DNA helicase